MKAWIRILTVTLTSRKLHKQLVFGENYKNGKDDLAINVKGSKYMSSLKDNFTVEIANLTYQQVVQIISGQYYDIEIKVGYQSSGVQTIFKGGILYISNELTDKKTNTIIILCASNLIAKYGQSRINLSLNSGINMYSAINFISKLAGIQNPNVSPQLKKQMLKMSESLNDTAGSWLNKLTERNSTYIVNSDSITGSTFSIFDANESNQRLIKLTNKNVSLTQGYPRLTSDGLTLTMLPTFSFMCGDTIEIDNSLIDISASSTSDVSRNYGYYLDKEGHYMIFEQNFSLSNRDYDFSIRLLCKSRSLISNYLGKEN